MTAKFIVGDTRAVTATLPDASFDLILTSPPFLALRSYLPADHPDKALEIGSEATPAEFIAVLLELTAEWRRVLAPHGTLAVELGDTYSGSGGAGGDYAADGLREGQEKFGGSGRLARFKDARGNPDGMRDPTFSGGNTRNGGGPGWPLAKSLVHIPERYRLALVGGRYEVPCPTGGCEHCDGTGVHMKRSPAGQFRDRNVIRWVRPNPPVGALGDKWRPATSDIVVACTAVDRYWDDVATRVAHARDYTNEVPGGLREYDRNGTIINHQRSKVADPAGAPLLDWWNITPAGFSGAHYAVYPPELCVPFIEAACPRRVCVTCGKPSRRETETTGYVGANGAPVTPHVWASGVADGQAAHTKKQDGGVTAQKTTTGWTTCGHPGTDGIRPDGHHTGPGWRPGMVLDPFAGVGTTLAVATGHGRDAIGIDLDSRNADLALERVGPLLLTVEHSAAPAA